MFDWFRKPKAPAPPPVNKSLFSTSVEIMRNTIDPMMLLKRSFQRDAKDFKAVDSAGTVLSAMDAPNAGNVNSMKPIISPFYTLPYAQLAWYASQGFIGYQLCGMLAQHWLIDKACSLPARDAMSHGYEISAPENDDNVEDLEGTENKASADADDTEKGGDNDSDVDVDQYGGETEKDENQPIIDYLKECDKKLGIRQNAVEFVRCNRIFGIRIAMFKIKSASPQAKKEYYENPFNLDGVKPKSYEGIAQIDPYWITPELDTEAASDPSSIHFYEPTWWRINGMRIHRTHLIVIRNGQVADILKPTYLYGGIPVPQKIAERVYAAERTANEAPQLALTKRTTIFKMNIAEAMANQQLFEEKMAWFSQTRDNYGVKAIGADDEAEQFDLSLTDVDQVIMTQYQIVAAASGVPATKLLGTSPKGFDATGEFETDSYHEELQSIQHNDMQPLIERHYELLMKSEIEPKFGRTFNVVVTWNPVDTPSAKELAEINQSKATTDKAYADTGAIDGTDIRKKIIADKMSGYNALADVVPGGPGDREAEQERREMEMNNVNKEADGKGD